MTHINYNKLKQRMCFTNKGFWKVQSIHKLTTRLQLKYNPKDYILLKIIKKPPPKIPPFISFEHFEKLSNKKNNLKKQKNRSCENFSPKNFFITNDIKNSIKVEKEEKSKIIFHKLYCNFLYEPFLYNELQFISLEKEKRLLPRKFNDVVKDCVAFREYKKYLNGLQKTKKIKEEKDIINSYNNNNNYKNLNIYNNKNKNNNNIITNENTNDNINNPNEKKV